MGALDERQAAVRRDIRRRREERLKGRQDMLTKQDDFIGRQLPTTFDHVMSSDPSWMERLWYTDHPKPAGYFIFDIGLGWHPNRNVMDGFGNSKRVFRTARRAASLSAPCPAGSS